MTCEGIAISITSSAHIRSFEWDKKAINMLRSSRRVRKQVIRRLLTVCHGFSRVRVIGVIVDDGLRINGPIRTKWEESLVPMDVTIKRS